MPAAACWHGSRARGLVAKHEEETQDTANDAAGCCMQQGWVAETRDQVQLQIAWHGPPG